MAVNFTLQPYRSPQDLERMADLVRRCPGEAVHRADLPYRLCSWAFDRPENAALWVDPGGQVAAWAVMQAPFWNIDLVCDPGSADVLLPQILAWADQQVRAVAGTDWGRPSWFVPVFPHQGALRLALERAGFADQSLSPDEPWSQVMMARRLDEEGWTSFVQGSTPSTPTGLANGRRLPEGFRLRQLAGAEEAAAYVDLHRRVFESKNMSIEWRLRTLARPEYRPDLDLVVAAPDGELAAFCIGWMDPHGTGGIPEGQIEPLGVHPAYRRSGLGSALLAEQIRRMRALGCIRVLVETDHFRDAAMLLYETAGFQIVEEIIMFCKEYGTGGM